MLHVGMPKNAPGKGVRWVRVSVRLHPSDAAKLERLSALFECGGKAAIARQMIDWMLDQESTLMLLATGRRR